MDQGFNPHRLLVLMAFMLIALSSISYALCADTKVTQSRSYWGGAFPFAITDYTQGNFRDNPDEILLVVRNNEPETWTLIALNLTEVSTKDFGFNNTAIQIGPGSSITKRIGIARCHGDRYREYQVVFEYKSPTNSEKFIQYGNKNLVVRCTDDTLSPFAWIATSSGFVLVGIIVTAITGISAAFLYYRKKQLGKKIVSWNLMHIFAAISIIFLLAVVGFLALTSLFPC